MTDVFSVMLLVGGHKNSLGRTNEVIGMVLLDKSRVDELYECLFNEDAWVRMRAADALEKVSREHPDWISLYIDKLQKYFSASTQSSIQWHLAQIYRQVSLTTKQKHLAQEWLKELISTKEVDWIVAANAMDTLMKFTKERSFPVEKLKKLLIIQQQHKSIAVKRRAAKLLAEIA